MTYRQAAKFYDLFGSKNDVDFYRGLALQCGNRALEIGVGTGRLAIPLAQAGITVVGIDNSIHMLRWARTKLAEESQLVRKHVVLKKGDMRNFDLGLSFPFIYLPASTFDHNTTAEEQNQTLDCVHKHLEKNGVFAFDLEQVRVDAPLNSWWIDRRRVGRRRMVVRSIFTRRDLKKNVCTLDLFFDIYENGRFDERYHEYGDVAIIGKDQIIKLLEQNHFTIENIYGDFDLSRHRKMSPKLVLVTRRV
ncbi:MAG: class I SAM-dependent methyltransferase [Candidatus Bathyarchaeota archaeon]|nr:MAG: class I SAM-dependent methyltransferase [Candidatus Bathyarchaeota archaeon]